MLLKLELAFRSIAVENIINKSLIFNITKQKNKASTFLDLATIVGMSLSSLLVMGVWVLNCATSVKKALATY